MQTRTGTGLRPGPDRRISMDRRRSPESTGNAAPPAPLWAADARTVPSSWLFIRDQESIWIERPFGFTIIVVGPGSTRAHLLFMDESAMEAYQVATAERLTRRGWFLWGFDCDRRQYGDRRAEQPTEPDRRHALGDRRTSPAP